MPPNAAHAFNVPNLIGVAVVPIVLISEVTILLSEYTGKYANTFDRPRSLAAEYRHSETPMAGAADRRGEMSDFFSESTTAP